MSIPVIGQESIPYLPNHFVPNLLHTDLWFPIQPGKTNKSQALALKWSMCWKGANINLHDIHRASIWIPVSVYDDTIITFVYEMRTSTDVVHIRRCASPVVKLFKTLTPNETPLYSAIVWQRSIWDYVKFDYLPRVRNKPYVTWMMLSKALNLRKDLADIFCLGSVNNIANELTHQKQKGNICSWVIAEL